MDQLSKDRLIIRLEDTESTNNYLKNLIREQHPSEGSMVIADYQSQGRGQHGNTWFSPKGKNLLFSFIIYPEKLPAKDQFIISRMISLAIKSTLDRFTYGIRIKWPNDIYWRDKKIAGILIENNVQDGMIESSVIGVGLNLNQDVFPAELPNPVSLKEITGTDYQPDYILDIVLHEFFVLYREFQKGLISEIEDEYMLDLYRVNDYYWFEDANGRFQAKIDNVQSSGYLVLRTLDDDQKRVYAFKEVQFVNE